MEPWVAGLRNCKGLSPPPLVALVDDEEELCQLVAEGLRSRGVEVVSFSDSQKALAELTEIKPDVLVFDIRMPKLGGFEMVRELRRRTRSRPSLLVMSGNWSSPWADAGDLGLMRVLEKPFDMQEMFEAVIVQFVEHPYDKDRTSRVACESSAILADGRIARLSNLSIGGAKLEHPLKPDDRVRFSFALGDDKIEVDAEVAWSANEPSGVKFLNLEVHNVLRLTDFVRQAKISEFLIKREVDGHR